jgi:hypothetical protein
MTVAAITVYVVAYALFASERLTTTVVAFGGSAARVGDPPDIVIAGRDGLAFNDFVLKMLLGRGCGLTRRRGRPDNGRAKTRRCSGCGEADLSAGQVAT